MICLCSYKSKFELLVSRFWTNWQIESTRVWACSSQVFQNGGQAMAANTAKGAEKKDTRTITFKNKEHRDFYKEYLQKCRYQDVYHKALVYCLGIDRDTRVNVDRIYDFKTGCVKTDCLYEGWQTSGSMKIVRMAFNLYCNGTPSVLDIEDAEARLEECQCYTVEDLFCCGYARFFWEAVKIRYPEYCFYVDMEDLYA